MLALRRLRCLPHSVPACQTRLLRTKHFPKNRHLKLQESSDEVFCGATNLHESIETIKPTELSVKTTIQESSLTKQRSGASGNGASYENSEANLNRPSHDDEQARSLRRVRRQRILLRESLGLHGDKSGGLDHQTHAWGSLQKLLTLVKAKNVLTAQERASLWRCYSDIRHKAYLRTSLPRTAWDVLWRSQYVDFSDMPRRQSRLAELFGHMVAMSTVGPEYAGQVAFRLEQRYMAGFEQEALVSWHHLRRKYSEAPEFLDTGARLFALGGFPDRAREIMDQLLELEPHWHTSVMLVVFRAYTGSRREGHLAEARQIYKAIKDRTGGNDSIGLYDNFFLGFLEAQSLTDARQVFRDMTEAGHLDYTGSKTQIMEVIRRVERLQQLAISVPDMSAIALEAIATLPVAYHGHLFGTWIGYSYMHNSPHLVAQIIDMMIERGYQPEPGHFEFLLRALFRTKESDNVLKAETLGWKMVEAARQSSTLMDVPIPKTLVSTIKEKLDSVSVLDADSPVRVPAANTATFALLMSHHADRLDWEKVDYLKRQLREADVAPDQTILNVLIDNKIRQGQFVEAWQIYKTLTGDENQNGSLVPNGATMRCLWRMLQLAFSPHTSEETEGLPTPREVLRETLDWWQVAKARPDAHLFGRGLIGLCQNLSHRLILHCFNQRQDLAGALVALHVLRTEWKVHPKIQDAINLQKQVVWVPMSEQTDSERRQFSVSHHQARNMERLKYTYDRISTRRFKELCAYGGIPFPMTEADAGDFELNVISEFVRIIMLGSRDPEAVELEIQRAQHAAGISSYMPMGDVSAFTLDAEFS